MERVEIGASSTAESLVDRSLQVRNQRFAEANLAGQQRSLLIKGQVRTNFRVVEDVDNSRGRRLVTRIAPGAGSSI